MSDAKKSYPTEEWMIPIRASLVDLNPVVVWEYARESETLRLLAEELKKALILYPSTVTLSGAEVGKLIEEARHCAYRYADFVHAGREPQSHKWHSKFFGLVRRLDTMMPDTEWRFFESADFPSKTWWAHLESTCRLAPRERNGSNETEWQLHEFADFPLKTWWTPPESTGRLNPRGSTSRPAEYRETSIRGAAVYARSLRFDGISLTANTDLLPGESSSRSLPNGVEVTAAIVLLPLAWLRTNPSAAIAHVVEWILKEALPASFSGQACLSHSKSLPFICIIEKILVGVDEVALSSQSESLLLEWGALNTAQANDLGALIVPNLPVQNLEKEFPRSLYVNACREAAAAGWLMSPMVPTDPGETNVWQWKPKRCIESLKWLGALRASKHLTSDELNIAALKFVRRLNAAAEALPDPARTTMLNLVLKKKEDRPFYDKRDSLLEAARKAETRLTTVFPSLGNELPITSRIKS